MQAFGLPHPGARAFGLDCDTGAPAVGAALFVSTATDDRDLGGGCRLLVDANRLLVRAVAVTDGLGRAHFALPLPLEPALRGQSLWAQVVRFDPRAPAPAFSAGVELCVGD